MMMEITSVGEIAIQILGLLLGVWFIWDGYRLNKRAKPFSLKDKTSYTNPVRDSFIAGGVMSGAVLLVLLTYKLLSCGIICWS
jgi:hypothetical protein